jgi:hypothetical protein
LIRNMQISQCHFSSHNTPPPVSPKKYIKVSTAIYSKCFIASEPR